MKKGYQENAKIQPKASAPLITQVLILDVCSGKYGGCEYINDNQTETAYDHDGVPFQVNTGVVGYGGHSYDSVNLQETTQHNYHLKEWI